MSVGNMTIKDALAKAIGPQAATELVERVDAKLRIGASKEDIGAKVTAFIHHPPAKKGATIS